MAESEPTMSGGQGDATATRLPLDQPEGAVELDKMEPSQPAVPAKDGALDLPASGKGKEKETSPLANRPDRTDSLSIGAADAPPQLSSNPADGPVCNITLLLPTGARHPYKIDDKYLTKRSVEVPEITENGKKDPFSISIYKLKELILREWRDEWDNKPASPSSIRLIHFGKLLDDKEQLKSERSHFCSQAYHCIAESETDYSRICRVPIQRRGPQRRAHVCQTSRNAGRRRSEQKQGQRWQREK